MPNKIQAGLGFSGDFDPNEITEMLGVSPTEIWIKGTKNPSLGLPLASGWSLDSEFLRGEAALNGYGVISSVIDQLHSKVEEIRRVSEKLKPEICFNVAVYLTTNDEESTPAIGFDSKATEFLGAIGASIDIDTYVGEWE